eukprot:2461992-Alexandrium_andersonii.AAC.2
MRGNRPMKFSQGGSSLDSLDQRLQGARGNSLDGLRGLTCWHIVGQEAARINQCPAFSALDTLKRTPLFLWLGLRPTNMTRKGGRLHELGGVQGLAAQSRFNGRPTP